MIKISLILATINRKAELIRFISSLEKQSVPLEIIELIIVDQNEIGYLDDIIPTSSKIKILHIHSKIKGLSYNRNLGMKYVSGEIVCFPDDDCCYNSNTIEEVLDIFNKTNVKFVGGRIVDLYNNIPIFKKWPKYKIKFKLTNFYFISSSITIFIKNDFLLKFDEQLGVGTDKGSCEDVDLIYRMLNSKYTGLYSPEIVVRHPAPNFDKIENLKVYKYASGFGGFVSKNRSFYLYTLFGVLIIYKFFQFIQNKFASKKKFNDGYFKHYFNGLKAGFFD